MSDTSFFPAGMAEPLAQAYRDAFGQDAPGRVLGVVSPGRTEIAGNHTDHEGGEVIAGAVDRYVCGLFAPRDDRRIRLASEGYGMVELDAADDEPRAGERAATAALVRGLAAGFHARGYGCDGGGFDAVVRSEVPAGSGLSSSAAFELLVAQALNHLWAGGMLDALELARMAQEAEHAYFGKPCGLMDQASVALGGIAHMDFRDPEAPTVERLGFDFAACGYAICLVAVGADHAANTDDYAAVPAEMNAVARRFGATRLCEVDEARVLHDLPQIRAELGDRAALRALHYFREDRLVQGRAEALTTGDMATFLELTRRSGASSAMYLQNVSAGSVASQPAMVALAVAEELLGDREAVRIHGGGFGGTIQAFVRLEEAEAFCRSMDKTLGGEAAAAYAIDGKGARAQWL